MPSPIGSPELDRTRQEQAAFTDKINAMRSGLAASPAKDTTERRRSRAEFSLDDEDESREDRKGHQAALGSFRAILPRALVALVVIGLTLAAIVYHWHSLRADTSRLRDGFEFQQQDF